MTSIQKRLTNQGFDWIYYIKVLYILQNGGMMCYTPQNQTHTCPWQMMLKCKGSVSYLLPPQSLLNHEWPHSMWVNPYPSSNSQFWRRFLCQLELTCRVCVSPVQVGKHRLSSQKCRLGRVGSVVGSTPERAEEGPFLGT